MEKRKGISLVLKIVIAVVLVVVVGIVIHVCRNYIIISNLRKNFSEYANTTNYHTKISYDDEFGHTDMDYYRKDDKKALFVINTNASGEVAKMLTYDNGKRVDSFYETPSAKTAQLNSGVSPESPLSNGIDAPLKGFDEIMNYLRTKISVSEMNGKECFIIEGYISSNRLYDEGSNNISFIDKETGIEFLRKINGKVEEIQTEVGNVDDSIFMEPNIGEYELLQNN